MYDRMERVNELLLSEISRVVLREVKDPRIGFATVTRVETSRDLHHARVLISVLGSRDQKRQSLDGLNSASGFIRSQMSRELHLRYTPELQFILDDSLERAAEISKLITDLELDDADDEPLDPFNP